jgi:uncharacterized protein YukE
MTDEQAKLLAAWLRKAAEWSDNEARRFDANMHSNAKFYIDQAARIRALCDRLEG